MPRVDQTYKLYYGGAQKRPDANYSRVVKNAEGKAFALVGESNRYGEQSLSVYMLIFSPLLPF